VTSSSNLDRSLSPVTTTVAWKTVVGDRLEELVHGLLEAIGAQELVWRAGASEGVRAADGGRDLEAVFTRVTPDGDLERARWWIEAKGRAGTVGKADVVAAVHAVTGRSDVDVFVFCTNSRFSNPTRDWVEQWKKDHPTPKVKLWDRDRLSRLVRDYPEVAARVLPHALTADSRLELLFDRFEQLGETPTDADLDYFWSQPDAIGAIVNPLKRVMVIAMMAYTDGPVGQISRPWASLIPDAPESNKAAVLASALLVPQLAFRDLPRPIDGSNLVKVAAYLLLAVIDRMPAKMYFDLLTTPASYLEGEPWVSMADAKVAKVWIETAVLPAVTRVHNELAHVCATDCVRVRVDPFAFGPPLEGETYWKRFVAGPPSDSRRLIIENHDEPCAVGLSLTPRHTCPLVAEPEVTLARVRDLRKVVAFRRQHPDGQFLRLYKRPPANL
jgi:hypothetical protein